MVRWSEGSERSKLPDDFCSIQLLTTLLVASLVAGSGERVKSKPHPEALSYICSCWGLDARSVCMVGDSLEDDVQAAARAGCRSLLINTGFDNSTGSRRSDVGDGELAEPDWVVGGFSEVLGVLRREGVAQ